MLVNLFFLMVQVVLFELVFVYLCQGPNVVDILKITVIKLNYLQLNDFNIFLFMTHIRV